MAMGDREIRAIAVAAWLICACKSGETQRDDTRAHAVATEKTAPGSAVASAAGASGDPWSEAARKAARASAGSAAATGNAGSGAAGGASADGAPAAAAESAAPIAAASLALASLDAGPGAERIITAQPPKPGASSIVTYEAKLDLDLNFGGMQMTTTNTQSKKKKVEIRAVDADGTVHKRITYIKRDTRRVVDGDVKPDPSPIRGKTYLLTWKDAVAAVALPSGEPASAEEVEAVRKEEALLQAPELLGRVLDGLRLVKGQPFEVPASTLEKFVQEGFHPRRLVLTYRGKTAEGTRIDAEGALVNNEARGMKIFVDIKAELVIDTTGWCRSLKSNAQVRSELNGVVVGSGAGTGATVATALR
jgi:hypothetical protein